MKAVVGVDNGQYSVNGIAAQFYLKDWNGWVLKKTRTSTEAGDNFAFDVDIEGSKVLVSRKYADKNGIVNVGAGVSYDYWSTIYSSTREAGDFEEAVEVNNLYPNPTEGNITLSYTATKAETATVEMYDLAGKKVYAADWKLNSGINNRQINLIEQAKGFYLLKLNTLQGIGTEKLVIE